MRTPDLRGLSPTLRARLGVVDGLDLGEPIRGITARIRDQRVAEARQVTQRIELRDEGEPGLRLVGYASTYDQAYPIGDTNVEDGGWGWDEIIAAGAGKRSIQIKGKTGADPDVVFLFNHDGVPLARTKNGSLRLEEDSTGLLSDAQLLRTSSTAMEMYGLVEAGLLDQMSFAFRVIRERWEDRDGNEMSWMEAPVRRIQEYELFDTSVVTQPANPGTSITTDRSDDVLSLDEARALAVPRLTLAEALAARNVTA